MREKVKTLTTQDIMVKIFADYANYRNIHWEHTYFDGADLLEIRLGCEEDCTRKDYHFWIHKVEKENILLACINNAIEDYEREFFEVGYTPESNIPNAARESLGLPKIEVALHKHRINTILQIEDLLLNSDLEWGITCDPKTKSYTICIEEVEV